ncbi:5-(carboxyamino)imidazole ribonucleotide synthase [Advenella alkanexedens]|uniref:5-(carboxyamino)imidazole ribonucleotide synthase n=1 Tax=Advenella alkanexedens TaxID=1481665 RepID=UPI002675FB5B|nr:5-(carboxyamino)imidazole ribonucleotide synthase [Advenella alkanexedens]WKU19150.1 5-(carboxyamino)imidazole ribonucleotide synthase [Advenella alkanexedens]
MNNTVLTSAVVYPGQWLGMLGGGQLGRMFCHAAQSMGYKVVVLDPAQDSPAGTVAEKQVYAAYDDVKGLAELAALTRVVTTEFENVPAASLKQLSENCRVSPGAAAVAVVQDRIAEKAFIASQGIPVAPYSEVRSAADLENVGQHLFPGILKAARLGYDGKGQARVANVQEALAAFESFGRVPCVLEAMLPLKEEISVVMARGFDGEVAVFPIGQNTHVNGILATTVVNPGLIAENIQHQAKQAAIRIAEGLNYFGVLCIEFFILEDNSLVANEVAPRPHNSGHYTMNACASSQFEQQVRVMAGMPLGSTQLRAPAIMLNILGDSWFHPETGAFAEPAWEKVLALPGVSLHLYGKTEARKGRKMGHVNVVNENFDTALAHARQVSEILNLSQVL